MQSLKKIHAWAQMQVPLLLMADFLRISKMLHFSKFFEIFEIHQYFLVKLLNALYFI